jgi:hypothetical protein
LSGFFAGAGDELPPASACPADTEDGDGFAEAEEDCRVFGGAFFFVADGSDSAHRKTPRNLSRPRRNKFEVFRAICLF